MTHAMRRKDRELDEGEARAILARADYGVLATVDAAGQPYAVPLNHVVEGDHLYFHCADTGHKLENLCAQAQVSYVVVGHARVLSEELTTHYESAIVFGRAEVVSDATERDHALLLLGKRFSPDWTEAVRTAMRTYGPQTVVVRIRIERLTGKANRA